jgi:hypothetical protein
MLDFSLLLDDTSSVTYPVASPGVLGNASTYLQDLLTTLLLAIKFSHETICTPYVEVLSHARHTRTP